MNGPLMSRLWLVAITAATMSVGRVSTALLPGQSNDTGLVLGRVIDAVTGQPVAGAIVRVSPPGGQRPVLTGTSGAFLFAGLSAGTLKITATAPGYLDGAFGRKRPDGDLTPLVLAAGERRGDVTIPLWPWASLQGHVSDASRDPIMGALVEVMRVLPDRSYEYAGSALTDSRGAYEVTGLAAGDYLVAVPCRSTTAPLPTPAAQAATLRASAVDQPSGSVTVDESGRLFMATSGPQRAVLPGQHSASMFVTTYYGGAATVDSAAPVRVDAGQTAGGLDIVMFERPRVRVDGLVTGPSGPVAGAQINLYPVGRDPSNPADLLFSVASAIAGPAGTFTLLAVPAGEYVVEAFEPSRPVSVGLSSDGLPQVVSSPSPGWGRDGLRLQEPLSIGERDITNLGLVLTPGVTVRGRVETDASPPDRAPEFRVRLDQGSTVATGANGAFEIAHVPSGSHRLTVTSSQPGWRIAAATVAGRDVLDAPMDVGASDVDGVVIHMSRNLGTITGTVGAAGGRAAEDATVVLFPADPAYWTRAALDSPRFRSTRTATGTFELPDVPDGDYCLAAIDDAVMDRWPATALLQRIAARAARVTVTSGQTMTRPLVLDTTIR